MQNHKKVIPFPGNGWRFWDYLEDANNPIEDWYQGLPEEGQDTFDSILKLNNKANSPSEWNSSKLLQGDCKEHGIWEWTFFADGKQQRLLGIFGDDERKKAIFLIGCYHKQKRYSPEDCLTTAIKRAKKVRKGEANLRERPSKSNI